MTIAHRTNAVARARRSRRVALALLAAAAIWAALMAFTAFRWIGYLSDGWLADVGDGTLYVTSWSHSADDFTLRGWHSAPNLDRGASTPGVWTWWRWGLTPTVSFGTVTTASYSYSIWPVAPLLAGAGAAIISALRRDRARRVRLNLCMNCGYPRKDIAQSSPCPECGYCNKSEGATPTVNASM